MTPLILYIVAFIIAVINPFTTVSAISFMVAGLINLGLMKNIDVRVKAIKYNDGRYPENVVMASDIEMGNLFKMQRLFAALLAAAAFIATTVSTVIVAREAGRLQRSLPPAIMNWLDNNRALILVIGLGLYLLCNLLNLLAVLNIFKRNRELGEEMRRYPVTKPGFGNGRF